ncbi:MAG: metal-dependent transcriptional regulator [Candidatus Nanohalobium sp.]
MGNERYLRKIYQITEGGDESTTTSELAEEIQVTDASASEAVAKLEEENLVCRAPYKGFTLSPVGKEKGKKLLEKNQVLQELFQKIGLETPEKEAEKLEDRISQEAAAKIEKELLQ